MVVYWILNVLHVVVAVLLVIIVLLQAGRGGGLSGAFGGGGATQTMFGGRGAGDAMTRATQIMGAMFMVTSLSLVMWVGRTSQTGLSEESQRFMDDIRQSIEQQQIAPAPIPFGEPVDGAVNPGVGATSSATGTPVPTIPGVPQADPGVTPPPVSGEPVPAGAGNGGSDTPDESGG